MNAAEGRADGPALRAFGWWLSKVSLHVDNTAMHPIQPRTRSGARPGPGLPVLLAILAAVALWAPFADAEPAAYAGASANGEVVLFTTSEKLVPGDTDNRRDVYERFYDSEAGIESYVTREVSTGPTGGNDAHDVTYDGVSEDGTKVFFSTAESLVPEDKDLSVDIYVRNLVTGTTSLVSKPATNCQEPNCGNAALAAEFDSVSADGNRVIFTTEEPLSGEDQDKAPDVYERDLSTQTTSLVSAAAASCVSGSCGNGAAPAFFDGASSDGAVVAFSSKEALSGEDSDSAEDVYIRNLGAGSTSLVTQAGTCPASLTEAACTPIFGGISADGSHIFFESKEQLAGDSDDLQDVYGWSGGSLYLVSTGPSSGPAANATYAGTTRDGAGAFFVTAEALSGEDEDTLSDVYERRGTTTVLISTGPQAGQVSAAPASFEAATPDGSEVFFSTDERLTSEDTDGSRDVYGRVVGTGATILISRAGSGCTGTCGDGALDASFAGASADGSHVFFETAESLVPSDTDTSPDIYERTSGSTTLISTGPKDRDLLSDPHLAFVSNDGRNAIFTTEERLVEEDHDTETDVYESLDQVALLISTRNPDELVLGPSAPILTGTTPASPASTLEPGLLGVADAETSIKLYPTADCSGIPAAAGTAAQLEGTGIQVTVAPGSTTTFHATATLLNDTSVCSGVGITYQQTDASENGGGGEGTVGSGSTGTEGNVGGTQPPESQTSGGRQSDTAGSGPTAVPSTTAIAPRTRITLAPGAKTRQLRPIFQFVDSTGQAGTRFFCKVDSGRWAFCSSPDRVKRLSPGKHVFRVKGTNSGLTQKLPVLRRFKVVPR
jgi:hypothetical protein